MPSVKDTLKAAKASLDARKFDEAIQQVNSILSNDPANYNANVFLGLALDKQGRDDDSEKAYEKAISKKPVDPLAWQGLVNLYEKHGNKDVDKYGRAARKLAEVYMELDDAHRCQSAVDKYVGFAKEHGTKMQYRNALVFELPGSSVYEYLEGRLPPPTQTYPKVIEISELDEKQKINRLIGERKTRLGAKLTQVTLDVKREIYATSPLEDLYRQLILWSHDDSLRRIYEERLLQRAFDVCAALPAAEKANKRAEVQEMARGLVILKHPFLLAWRIVLEWADVREAKEWDITLLADYMDVFPTDGLTKVLQGFLASEISPFPHRSPLLETDTEEGTATPLSAADRLALMAQGQEESSRSVMSQRIMGDYFLFLNEYTNAVEAARKALELLHLEQQNSGLELSQTRDSIHVTLATALIHYQTPRHHAEARQMFESILARYPDDVACLIGIGSILVEEEDYAAAIDFLEKALKQKSNTKVRAELAWCRALTGAYAEALTELQDCLEALPSDEAHSKQLRAEILYRIGICQWNLDSTEVSRKNRKGAYASFLAALQADLNYAPAYTQLGIYYADYGRDMKRARKCFQKAFELSVSEVTAAKRLAGIFADQADWDLAEIVAQRALDSGKVRPPPGSKRPGLSWPFAALGVCHLNNQEYAKAVGSFQAALRLSPDSYHSWVGLGEAYHHTGRFIAATKALEQAGHFADKVPSGDTWFARYMLANVHRELGDFEEATNIFDSVLSERPHEYGVAIAQLQTCVEDAQRCIELGLYGRASAKAQNALDSAVAIASDHPRAFNLWKSVGDALGLYASIPGYASDLDRQKITALLRDGVNAEAFEILADADGVRVGTFDVGPDGRDNSSSIQLAVNGAILAFKRAIDCTRDDVHAQAVAWFNLGWMQLQASTVQTHEPDRLRFLKTAVRCFKSAIELEARNAEYWNALGIATSELNAKVAQHAFVRSLHLNDHSARTWTNLGCLYLMQNDLELANAAFTRGQSADPDYAHAWLGQGLLAWLAGELEESQSLFLQAFDISDSASVPVKRAYALSTFDLSMKSPAMASQLPSLLQPLFALQQLKVQTPHDLVARHLAALLDERLGRQDESIASLTAVCEAVELEFEETESPTAMWRFAQAKADLARAQLAMAQFEESLDNAQTALDLCAEEPDSALRSRIRLSAQLTAGLANHHLQHLDDAISMFRTALEESNSDPDVICLLAQVLWAKGGTRERSVARDQLFGLVETHPEHAQGIMLLSVMALLDQDAETLDAMADELQKLRARTGLSKLQRQRLANLTMAMARLASNGTNAVLSEAQNAIAVHPGQPQGWLQLSKLAPEDSSNAARMAVLTAAANAPPRGDLDAGDLAQVWGESGFVTEAQRAIVIAPWLAAGWQGLART